MKARTLGEAMNAQVLPPLSQAEVTRKFFFIFGLAVIAGLPSLFIAQSLCDAKNFVEFNLGIFVGFLVLVLALTALACTENARKLYRIKLVRKVIKFTCIMRAIFTVIFPMGVILDTVCGLLTAIVFSFFTSIEMFGIDDPLLVFCTALAMTVTHGIVINMVMLVFCAVTFGIMDGVSKDGLASDEDDLNCIQCGYDLRGSLENCPECGQIISTEMMLRIKRFKEVGQTPNEALPTS